MKAVDLVELLLKHPYHEVEFSIFEADGSTYGAGTRTWEITGIGDVGHSDKVLILKGKEN